MEWIELSNQVKMPIIGFGTLQIASSLAEKVVLEALNQGYRLIDTAASYFNEPGVAKAIKASNLPREELFITSKVWVQDSGYENTIKAFYNSLNNLELDYLDSYLIHQPYGDYYGSWRAMEDLYRQGKIRAIGVCNFSAERYVDLCLNCSIQPMVNQIELHPFFQQQELIKVLKRSNCRVEAWGPLNEGQRDIFNNELLKSIARKYHKTVAQIILRWHIQNKVIVIPKTIRIEKMKENMDIFDFELDTKDMQTITDMDLGYSEIINHQSYTTAKWLNKYKIHD